MNRRKVLTGATALGVVPFVGWQADPLAGYTRVTGDFADITAPDGCVLMKNHDGEFTWARPLMEGDRVVGFIPCPANPPGPAK